MSAGSQHKLAAAYGSFAASIYAGALPAAAEETEPPTLPAELEIQRLWHLGLLGNAGTTEHHGAVRILDKGTWNRSPGADFLRAEIELGGQVLRGDIEIDPTAQDWERHGHGANPEFNNVILHVVLTRPPQGWYTRDSQHREIPVLYLPAERWQKPLGLPAGVPGGMIPRCQAPLAHMAVDSIISLLQAAAAHRVARKRKLFHAKVQQQGAEQAWYEALAETLGYSTNKVAMQLLASRAPLQQLKGREEALLFGVAGFLCPILPEKADTQARGYHRSVWDAWWPVQPEFALSQGREIPWVYGATRPQNHPHRRVAALAAAVAQWKTLYPLFNAQGAKRLAEALKALRHDYWDTHYSLPSAAARKRLALVGSARINDFLVNHVYVQDESDAAWQSYLAMRADHEPGVVSRTAERLFGRREDVQPLLRRSYAQQALLQIDADFCAGSSCRNCLFPEQLGQWKAI